MWKKRDTDAGKRCLVAQILTQNFDALGIEYMIGGSLASSAYGLYRYTNDVDIVADVRKEHIAPLVAALENQFYIDDEMIRDALQEASSFNVIYLEGMIKADIFLRQNSAWVAMVWSRRRMEKLGAGDAPSVYIASSEDMILQKLRWLRMGGGVSDRQWGDTTGMLKVQAPTLDYPYLKEWAAHLALTDLLAQAYDDCGIEQEL